VVPVKRRRYRAQPGFGGVAQVDGENGPFRDDVHEVRVKLDPADRSPDTEGVRELTRLVTTDPAWIASVVPIRDGLLLARRR